jgi:hypothetical protein
MKVTVSVDGQKYELNFGKKVNIIDVILKTEKKENRKKYSLLHILYNPKKKQFYKQIGISVYTTEKKFINLREDPLQILQNKSTVYLNTQGPCIGDFEPILPYEEFLKALN